MAAVVKARWDSVAPGRCFRWMAKRIIKNGRRFLNKHKKINKQPAACLGKPLAHPIEKENDLISNSNVGILFIQIENFR